MEQLFFTIFAAITVITSLMVAFSKKAMHAMLWLVVSFFSTACLFVLLKAEFVAVVQVMVYAGGILILYMFAIMLVDVRRYKLQSHFHANKKMIMGMGALVLAEFLSVFAYKEGFYTPLGDMKVEIVKWGGNSELVGKTLFTDFILPFELVAIVLLVAIVGAVVLGKLKNDSRCLVEEK